MGLSDPELSRASLYLDTLAAWNARVNLTAARTPRERARLLVGDVLPALPFVSAGHLLDVGSGNGSPGLVLALLREDVRATLLEPRLRRWAFLREAVRVVGISHAQVLRCRHDEYAGPPAETVTLRALSLPLAALAPLVAPGGRLLVLGLRPTAAPGFHEDDSDPERGIHVLRREPDVPRET